MPTGSASDPNPPRRRLAGFLPFVGVLIICIAVLAWKYRPHSISYDYALRVIAGDTLAGSIEGDVTGTLTWSEQRYPFTSRVTRANTMKSTLTSQGPEVTVKLRPDGYSYRHKLNRREGSDSEWEGRPARGVTVIQEDTLYTFGRPEGRVTARVMRTVADVWLGTGAGDVGEDMVRTADSVVHAIAGFPVARPQIHNRLHNRGDETPVRVRIRAVTTDSLGSVRQIAIDGGLGKRIE